MKRFITQGGGLLRAAPGLRCQKIDHAHLRT